MGLGYYDTVFADGVPINEMPTRGARPQVLPACDSAVEFAVDVELLESAENTAKANGITLFELFASAISMTLGKYTKSEDVVLGVPANMRDESMVGIIGMFVNSAPVRLKPVRDKNISEYYKEVREAMRGATRTGTLPFSEIVSKFSDGRDKSRNPIFDVSVNYLVTDAGRGENGISIEVTSPIQKMKRDFAITLRRKGEILNFHLQYSSRLFDGALVKRFVEQLDFTLRFMCKNNDFKVRDALRLPEAQREWIDKVSCSAKADVPIQLLHKLFEKSADENAEKTALVASDRMMTYRELDSEANRIANALIKRGVKTSGCVMLLLPRKSFYFSAMFGILKAGAAFIPCDPSYPAERILSIYEDSKTSCIITTEEHRGEYPSDITVLIDDLLAENNEKNPGINGSPDDLAYLIYTSGSTGKPKGVMLRHLGICNYLLVHPANVQYRVLSEQCSTLLSVTTIAFDMSLKETAGALCNGKTLVFADETEMNDPRALTELFKKTGADCINATPSRIQQYMEYPPFKKALGSCRLIMCGGEGYPIALRDRLREVTDAVIINTYGPTEITVSSNGAIINEADHISVGPPLLNVTEYIVDPFGELSPPGVSGELYIGGMGVALGYRNLPELTAGKFIQYNNERVFASGDLSKWDEDGNVVISGRLDDQVKLRGLRIELGEIEGLIELQPHITKAVAVIKKINGQDNLCAYFTADTEVSISGLKRELEKRLTHYMVPAAFMQLDEMPVSPNGKTDIKKLPEPEVAAEKTAARTVGHDNAITLKIKEILTEILGQIEFSNDEDLYSYGLNSLASVRLVVEIEKAFSVRLEMKEIREGCTISEVENRVIDHILANGTTKKDGDIEKLDEYGLTKTQEGIYVESLSNKDTCIYNIPVLIELGENIDTVRLKKAVVEAVKAHPYLRTRLYLNADDNVCQYTDDKPFGENDIETICCGAIDEIKNNLLKPFDLGNDRLFRVKLINADKDYLFLEAHHIIFDGTSKMILLDDISRAYAGEKIEAEKYDGYDVFAVENKLRHSKAYDNAKKYYRELLAGVESDCMPLCSVHDDLQPESSQISVYSKVDYNDVMRFCSGQGINPNGFFTAVYGYVLGRFADRDEAVFATVYNGRRDMRFAGTISMMVKTYPVICRPNNKNRIEYIKEISGQLTENMSNDVYSFAEISRDLGFKADSIFVYQNISGDAPEFCGGTLKSVSVMQDTAKANIEFHVYPEGDKIKYFSCFRSDVYSKEFMEAFISAVDTAVGEFMSEGSTDGISLVDDDCLKKLDSFNNTEVPYEKNDIVTLFRRQAEKTPEKTALVYKEKKYTYKQLDDISERIAGYLKSKGIGTEDVVSVLIPRCEYMAIVSLGILKSGAAYQPLDPGYPADRLEFMVKDASASLVIADEGLRDRIPNYGGDVFFTSGIETLPDCVKQGENPKPENLFILLYTSGSTGVPKGVMLEHRNIAAFCNWYKNYYNLDDGSKVAAYASYGFDACMMDMYPVLTCGGELHIIDEEIRLDLVGIEKYFNENGITHSFMTTQVGRQFAVGCNPSSLKFLSVGGEKLVPVDRLNDFKLVNGYGPTECTIFTTTQIVDKKYKRVPIGRPLDNMKLYVVDKNGRRVPAFCPGELWVAGHQVSRGYLNRPQKTAEVYIDNPFTSEAGYEKVYRTGDVVRRLSDGRIDFIGRNDGQVKIRGFRIELSEVEEAIRGFEGIKDATVQAFDAKNGGKFIAAYIVSDAQIDIRELNDFIISKKPPYMVPEVTMQIDKIPLNQNQKVDRRALPTPEKKAKNDLEKAVSHDNPITLKIRECLEKIIGGQDYANTEDLAAYGLNSLGIISLAVDLGRTFGVECDMKKLRGGCTIAGLEEMIIKEYMSGASGGPKKQDKKRKSAGATAPLSSPQFGVYAESMKNPYGTLYNIPFFYEFPGETDTDKLASAVETVLKAHPYVFTTLITEKDEVVQKRAGKFDVDIPVREFDEKYLEQYKDDFRKPYNMFGSRLFKTEIIKTEKAVYLFVEFHHIIFDGSSGGIFINQLKTVLEGGEIEAEKYDYFDFVESIDENSENYREAESYFGKMLENCECADEITPDLQGLPENGKSSMVSVPVDMEMVKKFCGENKITPAHLFLAAVFYTVSRFTGKRNAYISTISNGRSDIRFTDTFGMFVNTLPLGIEIGDVTALEFVKQAKEVFNGAIDNEQYPFARIAGKYNYSPDIFFAYQLGIREDVIINGEKISASGIGGRSVKFKTGIYVENNGGVESIDILYNDARHSDALMNTLAQCIRTVLYNIINDPVQSVRKISMLDEASAEIVEKMSVSKLGENENTLFHQMFEKQVALQPGTPALIAIDGEYTYRELDERANRVANALIQKGVKTGGRVVILLARTSKFFSAMFGVLKAGGAFIPSCPDYPKGRIASIIEDSGADFVITSADLLDIYDRAVDIDELEACGNTVNPDVEVSPDDLAYLIYTSGSTGKPKGVELRHRGIANYLTDNEYNPHVHIVKENCKRYGSVTTVSFDMNFKETAVALCNGLTLVFAGDDMALNPVSLGEFFTRHSVDVFNATPSRLLVYMEVPEFEQAMKNCKVILSGGEKYSGILLSVLREKTNARIFNTYGPTEITVSSNAAELTDANAITVGKPLYNYIEYVVDIDGNKLPPNVVGELFIGGTGVARGYNKLPGQTEKAFITYENRPFYRSGDYARFTDGGDVEILGRTDNQVKLRGLRIELGEIEKALTSIEGVRSGIVVIRKVGNEDGICAYFTAGTVLDESEMKSEMAKKLTDYMIPSSFNQLDEMPFTPNGKIDVKRLPEPKENVRVIEKAATQTEQILCDIFCNVLNIDEVSATDSFFDIGGTSLTVIRAVIQAEKHGLKIAYADVFSNPSPRELAKLVSSDGEVCLNPFGSISDFDYSGIENVLAGNTVESFENGEMLEIGDVILTGATGFLGIHILNKLLNDYDGKIYCLLRNSKKLTAENRLSSMYFYYFEESIYAKYSDRVKVIRGDITNAESLNSMKNIDADTFINCAANVKHFSKGTDIEDVNYYGVKNILDFCRGRDLRLVHVSTMSVGGAYIGEMGETHILKEDMLYIGQTLGSKYTNSKYLAEREILQAVSEGFNAKIMRVGTLSARDTDGEYQINFETNSSTGRIKSAYVIGATTYESMERKIEFSPIDACADAILRLARTPKECVVFHPYNNHMHFMEEVYSAMNEIGLTVKVVDGMTYNELLEKAKQDPEKARVLSSFMAYQRADGKRMYPVGKSNSYTMQVLYRMNFTWPLTSVGYMKKFLLALCTLGYFET